MGSTATCTAGSCTNANGVLSGIDAPLVVNGGGGTDTLDLDDTADGTGDTLVLTSSLIDGLDLHADGIGYSSIAELDIRLGSGGDTVNVLSTSAITTIEGRGGNEMFNVSSDAPTNLGSLNDIAGALTLDGGLGGGDVATLSDFGDATGDTGTLTSSSLTGFSPAVITYLGLETLHVDLGSGGDDLTMSSVHGGVTTVDAGAGNDDVSLHSSPASATITINGDGGDDWIEVQATAGAVTISGNDDDDTHRARQPCLVGRRRTVNDRRDPRQHLRRRRGERQRAVGQRLAVPRRHGRPRAVRTGRSPPARSRASASAPRVSRTPASSTCRSRSGRAAPRSTSPAPTASATRRPAPPTPCCCSAAATTR